MRGWNGFSAFWGKVGDRGSVWWFMQTHAVHKHAQPVNITWLLECLRNRNYMT